MKLQQQLFLVSLLLLSLPWAGCQYVKEIESALRFGQEQSLLASAQAIAAVVQENPQLLYPYPDRLQTDTAEAKTETLFFPQYITDFEIDGYSDDWQDVPARVIDSAQITGSDQTQVDWRVRYKTAMHQQHLYMLFEVQDDAVQYQNLNRSLLANGDRLVLLAADERQYFLGTSAPGRMNVQYVPNRDTIIYEHRIAAYWQTSAQGYTIELKLPLSLTEGRLGFYVVNQNGVNGKAAYLGSIRPEQKSTAVPWLVYENAELNKAINIFSKPGLKISIADKDQWQIARQGELQFKTESDTFWLFRWLYRSLLKNTGTTLPVSDMPGRLLRGELSSALANRPASQWYRRDENANQSLLSVAAPVVAEQGVIAALVLEQSSEQFLVLTDRAFNRLFFYSVMALGLTGLGLLGYASWLSFRVRKLSVAAGNVLDENGRIQNNFPASRMGDEIGDLSRSYGELLARIREYTEYLQTLSRKLSHELRTPLAVVHTSLDNLHHQPLDDDASRYHLRAKEGASRLSHILTAMSEASRVEESIQQAEREAVNLPALLQELCAAYQDVYKKHQLRFSYTNYDVVQKEMSYALVPDLLVQMLDKLVDNAADFTPIGKNITIQLNDFKDYFLIQVYNDGPLLPEHMKHQLFDNMVSIRETLDNNKDGKQEKRGDVPHLGLGLHIVRLIVEYHQGRVRAFNRDDALGVCFEITLPKIAA